MTPIHNICGLILAAGASERMGRPKAFLEFDDGTTLLARQAGLLAESGCKGIVTVVGAFAHEIMARHRDLDVEWILNERWDLGQFSSLQTGLSAAFKDERDGAIVLPVDVVGVAPATIEALIETVLRNPHLHAITPEYNEQRGHPVYISKMEFSRLIDLDPNDRDARLDVQLERMANTMPLPVNDPGIVRNVNTAEEWQIYRNNVV